LRIGIAFDLAPVVTPTDGPDDRFEEFDKPETVAALADVLRGEGHDVVLLGDGRDLLVRLLDDRPDLVWNLAEGEGVGRCREARVPAVLEMLGIPYTGSDPLTLAATLDKSVARTLVDRVVPVPEGEAILPGTSGRDLIARLAAGDLGRGPWIVKPAFEGSSKGIRNRSLVETPDEAASLFEELVRDYEQPILIEEFIDGDEVTVGLVGNSPDLRVLGSMRVRPRAAGSRFIYSLEVKRDWVERVEYETPPRMPTEVIERVQVAARIAYATLGCRDLARIDFRVRDGVPYFLEANPLPGLAPVSSDLVILAKGFGVTHVELIRRILHAALKRHRLMGGTRT
jgi:D-alanine-D-alanine ligase